ncbi:MAG: thioredoxin family protein [Bdellovibrionales bacterium]|nr:thioredoxin family protein [Bdellovibrionales bacterium]
MWIKVLIVLILSVTCFANTKSVSTEHADVKLILPTSFQNNAKSKIGIQFDLAPHWHIYWKNPGDSGAEPKFNFNTNGAKVVETYWPKPKRIPIEHLVNIGYEKQVVFVFDLEVLNKDHVQAKIDLEWLVCKVDCIPGFATLSFKTPTGTNTDYKAQELKLLEKYYNLSPKKTNVAPFTIDQAKIDSNEVIVHFKGDIHSPQAFPFGSTLVDNKKPKWNKNTKSLSFGLNNIKQKTLNLTIFDQQQAYEFTNINILPKNTIETDSHILLLLLFAFIGGLILNFMPCVLPVISIKAFSLLKAPEYLRKKECLFYALGVVTTLSFVGLIFLLLKSMGQSIGWGFQLQSPIFVFALLALFWTMSLMFLGAIDLKVNLNTTKYQFNNSNLNSFFTGILSVVIAPPCTGPLMGVALGATLILSPLESFLIFLFLGLGLASPFILFAVFKKSLSLLPKPGVWMEKLKQFFAFPLFATCLWLIWVLQQQKNGSAWLISLAYLLAFSFFLWFYSSLKKYNFIALILALLCLLIGGVHVSKLQNPIVQSKAQSQWNQFSSKKLEEVRKTRTVFIDYTAAWCITCQVNKTRVLDTEKTQKLFKKHEVYLMRADWTNYNKEITASLEKIGRNSVPVYLIYKPNLDKPIILPQILSFDEIKSNL